MDSYRQLLILSNVIFRYPWTDTLDYTSPNDILNNSTIQDFIPELSLLEIQLTFSCPKVRKVVFRYFNTAVEFEVSKDVDCVPFGKARGYKIRVTSMPRAVLRSYIILSFYYSDH